MKKLITMVIMMTTMLANADITNDFDNAEALYLNQNYNGAVVAFEKLITDYPTANKDILASAQYDIGQCYKYTRDYSAAAIAYNKVIADYPTANKDILASAQYGIGYCYKYTRDYSAAAIAYNKVIADYPTANKDILASAQYDIGQCYKYTRDYSAAAIAYNKVIADYPDAENSILARAQCGIGHCLIAQGKNGDEAYLAMLKYGDNNILRSLIDKVAATMSVENYIKFLTRVLMVVSATEENSEFLGKVKSKLELLK